jgi:hypothetical protein
VLDQDIENLEDFYEQVAELVGRPTPHEAVCRSVSRRSSA